VTLSLDFLHPDRLRCDRCGHALPVALDVWDGPESLSLLTEDEVAAYLPDLAADPRLHGMLRPGAWFATQSATEGMAARRWGGRPARAGLTRRRPAVPPGCPVAASRAVR
jgi:hypothetical protein